MSSLHHLVAASACVVLGYGVPALAQRGQDAALEGTARDATGAVITSAAITVSSPQLIGGPQATQTDSQGKYRLALLPPGIYEIVASHDGFKTAVRRDVRLLPGLTVAVDFVLEVSAVAERVEVDAPRPVVDVRTSSLPTSINRRLLENLPLHRTVTNYVNLAPGVVSDVAFGGTLIANPLSLDGASGNEPGFGVPIVTPNANWIDELQIVGPGADAQYGEFTGVKANAIIRSGSNRFSGLADYLTTRTSWTGNNRSSLTPQLRERFRPIEVLTHWDTNVQVGGPILRDKLWFFTGGEVFREATRPVSFSGNPRATDEPQKNVREEKYIVKLSGAPARTLRTDGFISRVSSTITGFNAGPLVRPEALGIYETRELIWNTRLMWTLRSDAFVDVRQGGANVSLYAGPPPERRFGPPAHFDQLTSVQSENYLTYSTNRYRPVSTTGAFVYAPPWARAHEFRVGFEYEHDSLFAEGGYVAGRWFLDFDGRPDLVHLQPPAVYRPTHGRGTWHAQDSWAMSNRVTLNVGVRGSAYRGAVPTHDSAFEASTFSPRLGFAWQIASRPQAVVRGHYGRYHEQMVTSYYDFLDPLSEAPLVTAQVVGPDQFVEISRSLSSLNAKIDEGLKYPFNEEWLAAVESELWWGIAAKAQFIHRDFKNTVGFVDPSSVWTPVQRPDPGPDGVAGTADDGALMTIYYKASGSSAPLLLTNPRDAYRRYKAVQAIATRRDLGQLDFQASYTWSRTVGSYNNAAFSNAANGDLGPTMGVFVNPNRRINTEGRTPQDFTHQVKLLATYRIDACGGLNVSGIYRYQSGRTWARSARFAGPTMTSLIFVEPRASRQLPAINTLDVRVEKTWRPARHVGTLGVFADVFNVTNRGVALRANNGSGTNLGVPTQWLDPRVLRVGVRLLF